MSHLFAYFYRLRLINRWSLMRNTVPDNVAEHSFYVALLTHALCTIANEVFQRGVPTEKIVAAALFHDAPEVFVSDIPTPVKHHNPEILQQFRAIERMAAERMFNMVPDNLKHVYKPLLRKDEDPDVYKWIKAADLLDAYLKCVSELQTGNREFSVAKREIEAKIEKLDMPEVDYFLKCFAGSFEKTLDEISEQRADDGKSSCGDE